MTRALNIPYLWVDALCIIQDSLEDREREAAKMQLVYQGAALTISALGAPDSKTGFIASRRGFSVMMPQCRDDGNRYVIREPSRDLGAAIR